jgi:spermidine/putrescine transport system permease protein
MRKIKTLQKVFALVFVFLALAVVYIPIILMMVYSFTYSGSGIIGDWNGFSFKSFSMAFANEKLMRALGNTLLIAVSSAALAMVIGTMSAVGIFYLRRRLKAAAKMINQIIVVNADIVTAAAFMLFFYALGMTNNSGYLMLIIAHTTMTIPYVVLTVSPRLNQLNPNVYDAGLDLGAGPMRTLFKVIIPQLVPAMIASFAMAFTLSVDDFVITNLNKGGSSGVDTLSTYLYTNSKQARVPQMLRALSTVIFIVSFLVVLAVNIFKKYNARKRNKNRLTKVNPAAAKRSI